MELTDYQCLRLVHSFFNLTRAYEKEIENKVLHLKHGLSIQDLGMLVVLGLYAPMTARQLADKMEISPAMTSMCVQKYVESGLLYREQDKQDRRNWWLFLTDEGKQLYQTLVHLTVETTRTLLACLEHEEQAQLHVSMEKIIQHLPVALPNVQIKERIY